MRVKRWVYICDHCGKAELEPESYVFYNRVVKRLPKNWSKLGKEVLCPRYAAVYSRFKKEREQENGMDV